MSTLGNKIVVAISKSSGNIIALRAYFYHSYKAIDFWACTNEYGRKKYSSHVLLWELMEFAKKMNINEYDLASIDPINYSSIYRFKNGLRQSIFEKLGDWEITNNSLLSLFYNKIYKPW